MAFRKNLILRGLRSKGAKLGQGASRRTQGPSSNTPSGETLGRRTCPLRQGAFLSALLGALLLGTPPALAQKTTEQFIPIGQSPGLSGKYTEIAEIAAVDPAARTITLDGRSVAVTARTHIWLDRSKMKQPSVAGDFSNLTVGRRVEVSYQDETKRITAAWIKVAANGE